MFALKVLTAYSIIGGLLLWCSWQGGYTTRPRIKWTLTAIFWTVLLLVLALTT